MNLTLKFHFNVRRNFLILTANKQGNKAWKLECNSNQNKEITEEIYGGYHLKTL